jgi:hypothetical protein
MKLSFTALLFAVTVLGAQITRQYNDDAVYRRRGNHDRVNKKMVEYWSRPDVFPKLPDGMKERVEAYIRQYPEYQWKGSSSDASDSSKKSNPCNTQ